MIKNLSGKIKAGFIYIGSIGDFGWTYSHEAGRIKLNNKFDNRLKTIYRENVSPKNFAEVVKELIEKEKCKVIVSTSYSYDSIVINLADLYPDIIFLSCAGLTVKKNLMPYMVDLYQIYYLNGLISGGITKTGLIGYIGAYKIPEIIRHLNSFAIGVREVNHNAKILVSWLGSWLEPEKTRKIASKMIEDGIDVIAYTEDSSSVVQTCQQYYEKTAKKVYAFSHYSPMDKFGNDIIVSGQLVDWSLIYIDIFSKILTNSFEAKINYWFAYSNAAVLGKNYNTLISNNVVDLLKKKKINIDNGNISLYDYIILRYEQFKDPLVTFDPYSGPLYSSNKELKILYKERAGLVNLLNIDWLVPPIFEVNY